jgi:hypothetical protein
MAASAMSREDVQRNAISAAASAAIHVLASIILATTSICVGIPDQSVIPLVIPTEQLPETMKAKMGERAEDVDQMRKANGLPPEPAHGSASLPQLKPATHR